MPTPKKTIKFNPLDGISRQDLKPVPSPEEISHEAKEIFHTALADQPRAGNAQQIVSYQLEDSLAKGTAVLLLTSGGYGFELPNFGFIAIQAKELKSQLKRPFFMSRALGGFITGGSVGFLFSFLIGEPKPKKYFFSLKNNHGKVIFISLEQLAVESVIQNS